MEKTKRVWIAGMQEDLEMTEEEYLAYEKQMTDPKAPKMIKIGTKEIHRSKIKRIEESKKRTKAYDLSDPKTKEEVQKFAKEIQKICEKNPKHPLDWYGKDMSHKTEYMDAKKNRVRNPMFSLIDANIVDYCLEKGFITSKNVPESNRESYWAISDIDGWIEFTNKLDAVNELNGRRDYAKKKEMEELEKTAQTTLKNPNKPEPKDINPDEIPL